MHHPSPRPSKRASGDCKTRATRRGPTDRRARLRSVAWTRRTGNSAARGPRGPREARPASFRRRYEVMRILITDGNERAALAAARSLVRAGHAVCVVAPTPVSLAGASRGVRQHSLAIDPLTDPASYAAAVGRI